MNKAPTRIIDELGRVVLPREVRDILGWQERTKLELWLDGSDNALILRRHQPTCMCCGGTQDLKLLGTKGTCSGCRQEIAAL